MVINLFEITMHNCRISIVIDHIGLLCQDWFYQIR